MKPWLFILLLSFHVVNSFADCSKYNSKSDCLKNCRCGWCLETKICEDMQIIKESGCLYERCPILKIMIFHVFKVVVIVILVIYVIPIISLALIFCLIMIIDGIREYYLQWYIRSQYNEITDEYDIFINEL